LFYNLTRDLDHTSSRVFTLMLLSAKAQQESSSQTSQSNEVDVDIQQPNMVARRHLDNEFEQVEVCYT